MKSIRISTERNDRATGVWYDVATGRLHVSFGSIHRAIELEFIPLKDFESESGIVQFSLGMNGSVVVCHHEDGAETWLPVDMWIPGGFTPPSAKPRGRSKSYAELSPLALSLVEARTNLGLSQKKAALIAETPIRTIQEWEQGRHVPTNARAKDYVRSIKKAHAARHVSPRKS